MRKTILALIISGLANEGVAVTCRNVDVSATGKTVTTTFSLSPNHAQLTKTCVMPPRGTCSFLDNADAVYTVSSRQYDPQIIELVKLSGEGPEALTWKVYTRLYDCRRCDGEPSPITIGSLFDGDLKICSTRI